MAEKIAVVFGASGFLGRHVVRELASRGWRVRAAVRRPNVAQFLKPLGTVGQIELVQANVRYRPSITEALQGADAVVNLVGILSENGSQKYQSIQAVGAKNIAELASSMGIQDMVQVSAIGADPESESDYSRTKAEGEAAVREIIPDSIILRPSVIFGPQDEFFNRFAAMAKTSPFLPLIGGGKTLLQPVYVDDVADCVATALEDDKYRGRTFELGGPEKASFKDLMKLMLRIIGRKRILVPLPYLVANTMGSVGDLAAFVPFIEAPITSDQVKLTKLDNVVGVSGASDIGTIADFDITPETMESILPTYLVRFRSRGQFSPDTV